MRNGVGLIDVFVYDRQAQSLLPLPGANTSLSDFGPAISPDGRYLAYHSDASGRNEVYVQPFPDAAGGKWIVSQGGGMQPRWRQDGRELFYQSADSTLMSVEVAGARHEILQETDDIRAAFWREFEALTR